MATNDKPEATIGILRDPALERLTRPTRIDSGQLPSTVCSQAESLMASLAHIGEHCFHSGKEIKRLVGELQGMIGKLPG